VPGDNESAGKHSSGKARKGSKVATDRARGIKPRRRLRMKGTYLAAKYARVEGRRGEKKAIVAVAHSILVIIYYPLERDQP
jgi:transposase